MKVSIDFSIMENVSEIEPNSDLDATVIYDDETALVDADDTTEKSTSTDDEKPKKKGSNRHFCWSDCYTEEDSSVLFMHFAKRGYFKPSMSKAAMRKQELRTEKAKLWAHACGRQVLPSNPLQETRTFAPYISSVGMDLQRQIQIRLKQIC